LSITFLETVDVRVKTGEDDSDISLSITFLENLDVRVKSIRIVFTWFYTHINGVKKRNGQ
jgi:hypothetical protein